jgi:DNA-binding transcriptional ArsR family regulator
LPRVLTVQLDAASVARIRIAPSPVFELVNWLLLTLQHRRHWVHGDPGAAARFALRDQDVRATAELVRQAEARHFTPDFFTPKPPAQRTHVLESQLEIVRQAPGEAVERELAGLTWPASDRAQIPAVVTAGLTKFRRLAFGDDWTDVEQRLTSAVHVHAERVAEGGVRSVLTSMHPSVTWTGSRLILNKPHRDQLHVLADAELVLVPSLLTAHRVTAQVTDPQDASLTFPSLISEPSRPSGRPAGQILTEGRRRVLAALTQPRTTRDLARITGRSEATVSHHLHALTDAGLATSVRNGRRVVYRLTSSGSRLADLVAR